MEVVRNWETHISRSAAVKMIMASQITRPTYPAVTRRQITQPYVCSSLLPHLLASLSNRLGGIALPSTFEYNFVSMDCTMEQSLKKTAVHIYGVRIQHARRVHVAPQTVGWSGTPLSEWNARHILR